MVKKLLIGFILLSKIYLSFKAAELPLLPDLLPIRAGSDQPFWRHKGRLADDKENFKVPPFSSRRN